MNVTLLLSNRILPSNGVPILFSKIQMMIREHDERKLTLGEDDMAEISILMSP